MRIAKAPSLFQARKMAEFAWPAAACLLLVTSPGPVAAASWDAELADGRQIHVDPATNRPIVESEEGGTRPLWDGVHRLSDGSTITIRSGIMVPNEEIGALRRAGPVRPEEAADEETGTAGSSGEYAESCDRLVLKTCGLRQACEADEPCQVSRQLRAMQFQAIGPNEDNLGWTQQRCSEALGNDEEFPACDQGPPLVAAACQELAGLVCGEARRCAASSSCRLARDLLDLEQQAGQAGDAAKLERVRQQCRDALVEHAFFPPCR